MLHKPDVTGTLARYVVATRWEDIPREVRHQAKRSLVNLFAVALAGCRTEPVEIALGLAARIFGRPAGDRDRAQPADRRALGRVPQCGRGQCP